MSFVVYRIDTHHIVSEHATSAGAQISATAKKKAIMKTAKRRSEDAANNRFASRSQRKMMAKEELAHGFEQANLIFVASRADFDAADEMVIVHNLLSGNPVQIRKSDRGTCVDPSTERYHSM